MGTLLCMPRKRAEKKEELFRFKISKINKFEMIKRAVLQRTKDDRRETYERMVKGLCVLSSVSNQLLR